MISSAFETRPVMMWIILVIMMAVFLLLQRLTRKILSSVKRHPESLVDIGHIPLSTETQIYIGHVNDGIVILLILATIICILLSKSRFSMLGYFLFFITTMYIIKTFLSICTILPDSSGRCTYNRFLGSCHELFFSGHVSVSLFCLVIFYRIYPAMRNIVVPVGAVMCLLIAVMAVISRNHYTIDVVGAYLMIFFLTNIIT